ncbi:MAG: MBL fold metallo-hydrolase [Deltaproteobacteria bacterium]|nr:MBL fold metallo-hydrolase [Deltaproteobacteria bacterium]
MKLTFLGATGTVTGSKYLLEADGHRVLIDCGLYQGVKQLRLRNWEALPVDPGSIDAVLLTHAHIDHSGFLPALARDGFEGRVFCTPPTRELCGILLPDSARIHEEDAAYANRRGYSKHHPALPLYTEADAERALGQFAALDFDRWSETGPLRFRFRPAGHILGAASVEVEHAGRSILFSGDLGRSEDLLMRPPAPPGAPDWVVIESTYGDRRHDKADPFESLAKVLTDTVDRGGVLLIPSFAVGRAQTLLFCFHEILQRELVPQVPIFMNSPMATDVTQLFRRSSEYHRLPDELCGNVCDVAHYVRGIEESKRLVARREPCAIISASGMASGGRVLHHLRALAPDARNTILFCGFQAPGTRGDALVHGATEVKIHGAYIPVEARVLQLDIFSAHADQADLLAWLGACESPPRGVFVTHGEPAAADTLRRRIQDTSGYPARVPAYLETVELD